MADAVDQAAVAELRGRLRGRGLEPADDGYDEARSIWNGMIDRRPAVIARCAGAADVIKTVRFARDQGLLVSVRGGGHNVSGSAVCDGGLMIDLSPMKGIRVDPSVGTVRVEPGVALGELDNETQAFGLAVPAGIVTTTGVGGLTLGGGIGWLMRKYGLTCDNLLSADVVTAEGDLVRVGPQENEDLFWGLRGGGGNFGVVTSFEFAARRLGPAVLSGAVLYDMDDAEGLLRAYRDWEATSPNDVTTILALRRVLPIAPFPEEIHGKQVLSVGVLYAGAPEAGEAAVRPLRSLGRPLLDLITVKPYAAHQRMFDVSVPWGHHYYWKSLFLDRLSDEGIDVLVEQARRAHPPWSYLIMFQLGGEIGRIGEDETAYGGRAARYAINVNAVWEPGVDGAEHIEWARRYFDAMLPHSTGGVYVNFLGEEGPDRVLAAYGETKFDRLVALKDRWDPTNLFRLNQNVAPSGTGRLL